MRVVDFFNFFKYQFFIFFSFIEGRRGLVPSNFVEEYSRSTHGTRMREESFQGTVEVDGIMGRLFDVVLFETITTTSVTTFIPLYREDHVDCVNIM